MSLVIMVYGSVASIQIAYTIIGFFFKAKKFKNTKNRCKYAVLIPARNEEQTIAELVKSIKEQEYPQELITVFVIAHNCTDKTAEIATAAGAICYEYNNPKKARKGYALDALLKQIRKDYATEDEKNGILTFDGYFIFDADNVLEKDCIYQMNKAFNNKKYDVFSGYSISKNYESNLISSYVSNIWVRRAMFSNRPRSLLNIAPGLVGAGVLVRSHIYKNGFPWNSLVEDLEMFSSFVLMGYRCTYCEAARFYEEHPTSFKIHMRQSLRWWKGSYIVLFKVMFFVPFGLLFPYHKKTKLTPKRNFMEKCENEIMKRISVLDFFFDRFYTFLNFIQFLLGFIFPLIFYLIDVFNGYPDPTQFLWTVFFVHSSIYVVIFLQNILMVIREHKIIKISPLKLILYIPFWPIMGMFFNAVGFFALFLPVKWKPIPHVISKSAEECQKEKNIAQRLKVVKSG